MPYVEKLYNSASCVFDKLNFGRRRGKIDRIRTALRALANRERRGRGSADLKSSIRILSLTSLLFLVSKRTPFSELSFIFQFLIRFTPTNSFFFMFSFLLHKWNKWSSDCLHIIVTLWLFMTRYLMFQM